ncbi:MAG: T9SS type A sorting domain-containing protein, partial [Bacteroidota bacterium]
MKKLYLNLRIMAISVAMATIFLFAAQPGSQAQDIVKVKTDGVAYSDNHQDHLTWDDATNDLQAAIDDLAGSEGGEIWVAGGTYKPTIHFSANPETEDQLTDPSDRYLSFVIRENVTVRGGFMGDETDISERPEELFQTGNTTILSGDVGTENEPADNSYHVVIFPDNTSEQAFLDGFMITGGNANDGTEFNGRGGGIHARQGGHIINCQITGNNAGARGGGAYLYKGGLIEESEITDNSSGQEGGGVLLNLGGVLTNSEIRNNATGTNGGGVFLFSNNSE